MKKEFCKKLLDEVEAARPVAKAFSEFLRGVYAKNSDLYDRFFVRKETVAQESLPLAPQERVLFVSNGLLVLDKGGARIRSGVMVHRNLMDIENNDPGLDKNPAEEWFIATDWPDVPPEDEEIGRDMVFPIWRKEILPPIMIRDAPRVDNHLLRK